ncbi:hypothetical protein [Fulvimarina sp. MAC8]|uniref:hypothetical protein n=1 Tax=Fulvimarina sp. MAC8 TaxID=3162874 RepID=UPI0032EE278B
MQTWGQQAKDLLSGDWVTAAINLKELILIGAGTSGGLIWLIKTLKGRNPDRIEKLDENTVRITIDTQSFTVPIELLSLYQEISVRKAAEELIRKPLSKSGIEKFKVIEGEFERISVKEEEAESFRFQSSSDRVILDDVRRSAFSMVSLTFKEGNKWRLFNGTSQISALIEDEDFIARVDNSSVSFSKGDVLICDVRIIQSQSDAGLKTEYIIKKVIEHLKPPRQMSFPDFD